MEKWKVSEVDLIMYCIENEIPSKKKAEKRFKTFQTKGKLDGNSIKSFMEDVLTSHVSIEIASSEDGKLTTGRNRLYLVGELRELRINRNTNNIGLQVAKDQDVILKEYVFNRLCTILKRNKGIHSITEWTNLIGVYDTLELNLNDITQMFNDYYFIGESKRVAASIVNRMNDRNKESIELAFNQLDRENRIHKKDVYFSTNDKKATVITLEEYGIYKAFIREQVQKLGMEYKTYVWLRRNSNKATDTQMRVIAEVKKKLLSTHGIDGTFKAYEIEVANRKKHLDVSKEMMTQAYFEKLVALTGRNLKKMSNDIDKNVYVQTGFVEKEFAAFNMFLLIHQHLGEMDLETRLMELLPTKDQIEAVQGIHRQHGIEKKRIEDERIRNSETFIIEE